MLDECRKKTDALGVTERCTVVQADVFAHDYPERAYDCVLVGFLLSHLTEEQEQLVFEKLGRMLDASGRFLILDSAWSPERARFNAKIERQERRLNDGSRFEIYKRYIDRNDITNGRRSTGVATSIEHLGTAFVAVSGLFGA